MTGRKGLLERREEDGKIEYVKRGGEVSISCPL